MHANNFTQMQQVRLIFSYLLTLAVVAFLIKNAWTSHSTLNEESIEEMTGVRQPSLEEHVLLFQSRILLGSKEVIRRYQTLFSNDEARSQVLGSLNIAAENLRSQLSQSWTENPETEAQRYLLRDQAIVSARLNAWNDVKNKLSLLQTLARSKSEIYLDTILSRVLIAQEAGERGINSEEDSQILSALLLDFYPLVDVESGPNGLQLKEAASKRASDTAIKFVSAAAVLFVLALIAGISFLYFFWLFFIKRTPFAFKVSEIPHYLGIETFALYLLYMLLAPQVLYKLMEEGYIADPLIGNLLIISLSVVVIAWPVFFGISFGKIRRSIGLYFDSLGKFIRDLFVAPFFYLAGWVVLATILIAYSYALQRFNVDVSQGAHPIVPILLSAGDSAAPIRIALLATLAAPIIEEIMFRGVLYGALRQIFSAGFAIPVSALIFASIHPQGPIGLVPLTAIGMFLAFLREWRGTLIAPIIGHACVNGGTLALILLFLR